MLAGITIRLATLDDAPAIAEMSRDYIETGLPWGWRPERVAQAIRHPEMNVVVVGPPGRIEAFGIMEYLDTDAYLALFAVHPLKRRQGIGSAVLAWLEDVARAAGAKRIRIEARRDNVPARNFYSEHGYHERAIAQSRYGESVDGVRLEKWLRVDD